MAFTVTCPSCGKSFQLAEEIYERKVSGKVVSIKCKQCQAGIRVDATVPGQLKVVGATPAGDASVGPRPPAPPPAPKETQREPERPPPPAPAPAPARVRPRQPTLIGMVNPSPFAQKPREAPPRAPPPRLWVVDSGGEGDDRELNEADLEREVLSGALPATTLAWREGMAEWLELGQIPELAPLMKRVAAAQPAPEPAARATTPKAPPATTPVATPAAPEATPNATSTAPDFDGGDFDGGDGEATVVYDRSRPDAAPFPFEEPRPPPPPPAPAQAPKAPAPAAGAPPPPPLPAVAAPPPAPPLPPPARPAPPPAARPVPPAAAPLAPPPAPSAAQPAPAFPAPPAPVAGGVPWDPPARTQPIGGFPPAAPSGPDPFAVAASADLDFPQPKSKLPLVIAAAVGALAVIGVIVAVSQSGGTAPVSAPPPAPAATSEPVPTRETEPTPSPETPMGTPAQGSGQLPSGTAQPTSGGFSAMFEKGAERAHKGSGGAFDAAKAREALAAAVSKANACKEPGGPTGRATASVTFEPGGSVTGVTVGAPFSGTSTGACIVSAFRGVKIAPFSGLPGTVSQAVTLR